MARFARLAERALDAVAVVVFLAMFAVICAQVLLRYVFNAPFVWSDEFAQYCFVWVAFLGVARAARNRTHIGIDAVVSRLPPTLARMIALFWLALAIGFSGLLVWQGIVIVRQNATVTMTSMPFPYWIVYAIVPIVGLALIVYALRDMAWRWRGHEPGSDEQPTSEGAP